MEFTAVSVRWRGATAGSYSLCTDRGAPTLPPAGMPTWGFLAASHVVLLVRTTRTMASCGAAADHLACARERALP